MLLEQVTIRSEYRDGDADAIIAQHAELYPAEHRVDGSFVAHVAASVGRAMARGFPREREAIRIVEVGGRHMGSIAVTDEGAGEATLRWVLLDPGLRGGGRGRRLVEDMVEHARQQGFTLLTLETFSALDRAAAIYTSVGFELVSADPSPRWGRDDISYQRYELALAAG